jgi:fumarylacetoacetase
VPETSAHGQGNTTDSPDSDSGAIGSFIEVPSDSDFPIQNLPYGVFRPKQGPSRVGVAIGEMVVDLNLLTEAGLLGERARTERFFADASLNRFMASGRESWREVRTALTRVLRADCPDLRDNSALRARAFQRASDVTMHLPLQITGYTDFFSSIEHATNVGALFRGRENALMPNWRHVPIAYDGRASSIVVSGTDFHRPVGQTKPTEDGGPIFGPCKSLDFELELAFLVGTGNGLGESVPVDRAEEYLFGMLLLNDWSARDIQKWEYQPLGPFLAKNFCTSVSPWIVTMAALEPFKVPARTQEPEPLPYLRSARRVFDVHLEVSLRSAAMKEGEELVVCKGNSKTLYWDHCQQLAHHTSNGCPMQAGDIFASGTISGEASDSLGSMLELTQAGKSPVVLPSGEERRSLQDGDSVTIRGWCQGKGYRVGFGEVLGTVLPARAS